MNVVVCCILIICVSSVTFVFFFQSHNHSKCIRPPLPNFNVIPQRATFYLRGSFVSTTWIHLISPVKWIAIHNLIHASQYHRLQCHKWNYRIAPFLSNHLYIEEEISLDRSATKFFFSIYSKAGCSDMLT